MSSMEDFRLLHIFQVDSTGLHMDLWSPCGFYLAGSPAKLLPQVCKGRDPKVCGRILSKYIKATNKEGREELSSTTYLWGNP